MASCVFASTLRTIDKIANDKNIEKDSLKFLKALLARVEYSIRDFIKFGIIS
jgi:hypothetical protein